MLDLDERIHSDFRSRQIVVEPVSEAKFLRLVAAQLDRRRRHRQRTRWTIAGVSAGVVALALGLAGAMGIGQTPSSVATGPSNSQAIPGDFTVSPNTRLVNGQAVVVSVHHLASREDVVVVMCAGAPRHLIKERSQCDQATALEAFTSQDGSLHVLYHVDGSLTLGSGYRVNCATYPPGCSIAVASPINLQQGATTAGIHAVTFSTVAE